MQTLLYFTYRLLVLVKVGVIRCSDVTDLGPKMMSKSLAKNGKFLPSIGGSIWLWKMYF